MALQSHDRSRRRQHGFLGVDHAEVLDDLETTVHRASNDLGRAGVSNAIWEKPGPLGFGEWERVRLTPHFTERAFAQAPSLAPLGVLAGSAYERLDGTGYGAHRTAAGSRPTRRLPGVSVEEVDAYLRGVEEPKRSTLEALRAAILEVIPDAEQVISYRVPAFRTGGGTVAGFAAFRDHLSYLPFSGSVLAQLRDELAGYTMTKSALHFPVDRPLPQPLVEKLIAVRIAEIQHRGRR